MWILVVVFMAGDASSSTAINLSMCIQQFESIKFSQVKNAYCQSGGTDDRVYLVKDGVSMILK